MNKFLTIRLKDGYKMKKTMTILALLMLTTFTLVGCNDTEDTPDAEYTTAATEAEITEPEVTEAEVTEPVITEPEVTEPEDDEDPTDEVTNMPSDNDPRNPDNYWITINNEITIHVGMTIGEVLDAGMIAFDRAADTLEDMFPANSVSSFQVSYLTDAGRNAIISLSTMNPTGDEVLMTDVLVTGITVDTMSFNLLDSVEFFIPLVIGVTTVDDVEALLGAPDDYHDGFRLNQFWQTEDYGGWRGSGIELTWNEDNTLNTVRLNSFPE